MVSSNEAFNIGQSIGNTYGKAFQQQQDSSSIQRILSEATKSNNPEVLQNSIGQILSQVSPDRQDAALQYLQSSLQHIQSQQAAKQGGYTPGAPPQVQAVQAEDYLMKQRLQQDPLYQRLRGQQGQQGQQPPAGSQYDQANLPNAQQGTPAVLGGLPDQRQNQQVQQPRPQGIMQNQQQSPKLTPQPTPPKSIINDLTEDELMLGVGHPDKQISQMYKAALDKRQNETKVTHDDRMKFHTESEKYDTELHQKSVNAKSQLETLDTIEKAIKSGNIKPKSISNFFKGMGKIGDKLSEAYLNKDQAALTASLPQLFEGWKDVFGTRLSDADLRVLQDKMPSITKSPEANLVVVKIMRKYADMNRLRGEIAKDIKKENGRLRPLGYADMVEERLAEQTRPIMVINPANNKPVPIPAYKVAEALKVPGARLANEQ